MRREAITMHSESLDRDMNVIVYGEKGGWPVIVTQTQNSMANNWEDFGMVDTIADYVDGGKVQLFSIDSVDQESWSDVCGDKEHRAAMQEAYYAYVCDELLPLVHERNGSDRRPLLIGCSMGGTHAAIFALRRPDLFEGCLAMSGVYDASFFFGDWMNDTLYLNSPTAFLPNTPVDHPYVDLYNQRTLVLVVGQGAWEDEGIRSLRVLDEAFARLGVSAVCDYWGFDVNHDWPWWKKQIRHHLPLILDEVTAREEATKAAAKAKAAAAAKAKATKPAAKKATTTKKPATTAKKPAAKKTTTAAKKPAAKKTTTAKATTTTKSTTATAKKPATTKATTAKAATATKKTTATKAATTTAKATAKPATKAKPRS